MFGKKKKKETFFDKVVKGASNAVTSVRENSSITEELELAAAKKIMEMATARVATAEKALTEKRAKLSGA